MKMNRIYAAFTALVMVIAMIPATLADSKASTITMVPELNEEGTKLVVTFMLDTEAEPLSGVVDLYYETEYLENPAPATDSLPGQASSFVFNTEEAGNALIAFAASEPMKSGEIFNVTFDVKEACTPGTTFKFDVDLENCELIDNDTTTVLDLVIEDVEFTVPTGIQMGDVNMNGMIESGDATLILRDVVGSRKLSEEAARYADVNNSGTVDAGDATMVLRIVVGVAK